MISGFVSLCQTLSLTVFSCVSFLSLLSRTPHCCFPVLFSYFPVLLAFFFVSQDISLQFDEDYTPVFLLISPLRLKFSKVILVVSVYLSFLGYFPAFLRLSSCSESQQRRTVPLLEREERRRQEVDSLPSLNPSLLHKNTGSISQSNCILSLY